MPSGSRARKRSCCALVPDAEREHPPQRVHHLFPALGVEMQQHLGVGVRAENAAPALELAAQLAVVVDLAVERDAEAPVGGGHRLRARLGQVDDREAPVGEADPLVIRDPQPCPVGAAPDHVLPYAEELLPIDRRRRIAVGIDAGDAAHATRRGFRLVRASPRSIRSSSSARHRVAPSAPSRDSSARARCPAGAARGRPPASAASRSRSASR